MQITPALSRVKNIGLQGIHKTQTYAEMNEKGEYPVSNGAGIVLSELAVYHLSHDNSPYQLEKQGKPSKQLVCKGTQCTK